MTRSPACEDAAAIAARLAEIQRARMQAIAGCSCPQRDTSGNVVHTPLCPLRRRAKWSWPERLSSGLDPGCA
jgi:hypothetical protein